MKTGIPCFVAASSDRIRNFGSTVGRRIERIAQANNIGRADVCLFFHDGSHAVLTTEAICDYELETTADSRLPAHTMQELRLITDAEFQEQIGQENTELKEKRRQQYLELKKEFEE